MGRKRDEGLFVLLMQASARLPWWLSLLAAAAIYLVLHTYATHTEATPKDLAGLGVYAGHQIWRTLALFGQYLAPAALGIGAVFSVIKSRQRRKRYEQTAALGTASALLDMTWQQFEGLVQEHFRREGYTVTAGGGGPDGGIDAVLTKGGERFLVQCKQWRATKVGVDVVRQLYGVMAARGAIGGFVVSSGAFTPEARAFAHGRNVRLVNGNELVSGMRNVVPAKDLREATTAVAPNSTPAAGCPKCGAPMVRRAAKQGPRAGESFWGCSTYPNCRGVLSVVGK